MFAVVYGLSVILNLNKQVTKVLFYLLMYLIGHIAFSLDVQRWKKGIFAALLVCICISVPSILAAEPSGLVVPMATAKSPPIFWYAAYSLVAPCLMLLLKSKHLKQPLLSWIGKNCFLFYLAQGVSSSFVYFLLPYLENMSVSFKFFICLAVNIGLAFVIVKLLVCYYTFLFGMKKYFAKK